MNTKSRVANQKRTKAADIKFEAIVTNDSSSSSSVHRFDEQNIVKSDNLKNTGDADIIRYLICCKFNYFTS